MLVMTKSVMVAAFISVFTLVSCGNDNSKPRSGKIGDLEYTGINTGGLNLTDKEVSGNGSFVFNNPLGEVGSAKNYFIRFNLEDKGELVLHSHSDNKLNSGLRLSFYREGNKLQFTSSVINGNEITAAVSFINAVDPTKEIAIYIDVHNNEKPAHVVIWGEDEDHFHDHDELYNSEKDLETPGNGKGSFWGVELTKAKLLEAKVGAAKFDHHHDH